MRQLNFPPISLCLLAVVAGPSAQPSNAAPSIETIVVRMVQAHMDNEANLQPFAVTRDYKLLAKETQAATSQVMAEVVFTPPDLKSYTIRQTSGTGLEERIVRPMLTGEAEIAKDGTSTDFSSRNYDFRLIRSEITAGRHCYMIELIPRRQDKNLIRGNIWIDAETYLPLRTEGEPAKNPSWWVRDVHIAVLYSDVGGMWLQTSLEATATVRILGAYRLISRDMKCQMNAPPVNSTRNYETYSPE